MVDIKKYFWHLNPKAIKETEKIIKDPEHPRFVEKFFNILSRCDNPKVVFSIISKEKFVEVWPRVRKYWTKKAQALDFKSWWETVYEKIAKKHKKFIGTPSKQLLKIGQLIREERLKKNLTQRDLAQLTGISQSDISLIELGKKNITLLTLLQLAKVLNIKKISLD